MRVDESAFERAALEARTIQEQTGFLPALDDPRLKAREILSWFPLEGDGPIEGLLRLHQPEGYVARAVVAATLCSLMGKNPWGDGYDTLASALQRLVASVALKDLTDPALLRWELHLAATANSLERALEVSRRLEDVEPTPEIRAQVANTVFLLVHPSRPALDFFTPSAFDPLIHPPQWEWQRVSDLFTYILATTVEKRGNLSWKEPATFPPSMLDALIDIEVLLKRVQNATKSLTPTQQAVQSWCWFAQGSAAQDSGKLNEAGRSYLALPTFPADGGPVVCGSAAATICFALACNWSATTEAARKWIADLPKDAQARRRLAEAHYKQNEIPEAVRAFEDYVRLRQGEDEDWESSLLLHLGLEVHARRSFAAALEAAAFSASIRAQGERLVAWFCPWFDSLSRKTKERWWVGIFSLTSPHVATEMESERWDVAADSFGEAVAFELKERVFAPFVADSSGLCPPDGHWKRALAGRGMLGEMIECLLQSRQPNHQTAKQLSAWLTANRPGLREHIRKARPRQLLQLARLRGQAQHASVTESETRELFVEAADMLRAIAGN